MALLLFNGCGSSHQTGLDVSMYQYRDTRKLVQFVHDAAARLQEEGVAMLDALREDRALWRTDDYYLYVYDIDGVNLFHAGMPELEGRALGEVTDMYGRCIHRLVVTALEDPHNPHAWIHYSWWEPDRFYPVPKSSCHFKVTLDNGQVIYVGGGMSYPHEEREFVRILVDTAADLLTQTGLDALVHIEDPASKFSFRDVRVFVFRHDGEMLVSPVVDAVAQTGLLSIVDEAGHQPFEQAMRELEEDDFTWGVFMARNRYRRELIKKAFYIRRIEINNESIYVAAVTDLPMPPY